MIVLPFPHKALWPNGRAHYMAKAREVKKHREWAFTAALKHIRRHGIPADRPVVLRYIITPKTRHAIDIDNIVAAMKSYQDGIAQALGIDDSQFAAPEIGFAAPAKPGQVEVML